MTLNEVVGNAEQKAEALVESLRQRIALRVISTTRFDGVFGSSLRSQVEADIHSAFRSVSSQFQSDFSEAWAAGIARVGSSAHSTLIADTSMFQGALERSFAHLESGIAEEINRVLIRASLNPDWPASYVMGLIGRDSKLGLFADYTSRANGIVNYALNTTEAAAFAHRAKEAATIIAQKQAMGNAQKNIKKGLVTMVMKIWHHSHGGNPPRKNHLAFDKHAVPVHSKFKLRGRDGNTYSIEGPHDSTLPPGEVINCHCRLVTQELHVMPEEKIKIERKAAQTGGYVDARWSN